MTTKAKEKKTADTEIVYDAQAEQRFKFEIVEGGERVITTHVFHPLSDDRYLQFLKEAKITVEGGEVEQDVDKAQVDLWRDLVKEIADADVVDANTDFRDLIDVESEIMPVMNAYLPVSIALPEKLHEGRRQLSAKTSIVVTTEALFNARVTRQTHTLKRKTDEFSKMYDRLMKNEYQQEKIGGLRGKPKMKFHPQVKARGELYDLMFESVTGFAGNKKTDVPVRFKAAVINEIFDASTIDPKK